MPYGEENTVGRSDIIQEPEGILHDSTTES